MSTKSSVVYVPPIHIYKECFEDENSDLYIQCSGDGKLNREGLEEIRDGINEFLKKEPNYQAET